MKTIAYSSPFVPPEWIAAHGFEPAWTPWRRSHDRPLLGLREGVCPYAGAMLDAILGEAPGAGDRGPEVGGRNAACGFAGSRELQTANCKLQIADSPKPQLPTAYCPHPETHVSGSPSAVILTTTCDQMRHAAAVAASRGEPPVFLMNVPATWQTSAARALFIEELQRLGRFLATLGGSRPTDDDLLDAMFRYDKARATVQTARTRLSPRQFAAAIAEVRSGARNGNRLDLVPKLQLGNVSGRFPSRSLGTSCSNRGSSATAAPTARPASIPPTCVPLAIVGGPLLPQDDALFELIEQAGGYIVLDATEGGQRTLPAPFDCRRARQNPREELCAAYFGSIPDVFRRPNHRLYDWLGREIAARGVRGILFRRYLWCDLWHAELQRLKQWSPVPVLDADVADDGVAARLLGRLEAFVEMLQGRKLRDER